MKKYAIILTMLLTPLVAQQVTLFSGPTTHGGYGGPAVKFTQMYGSEAFLVGGQGGWIINHTLFLGGAGYGLVNGIKSPDSSIDDARYLDIGYGGMVVGLVLRSDYLIHLTLTTLMGGGSVGSRESFYHMGDYDTHDGRGDEFWVVEPNLELVVNMTRWFRVSGGVSYRHVIGINEFDGLSNDDLTGLSAQLSFNFGRF